MRQVMCVHLRQWAIDRARRRSPSNSPDGRRPLVTVRTVASRQVVVAASDEAISAGVRAGMTLAQARAMCPSIGHVPHEPEKDLRALAALARWMMRFSPVVAIHMSGEGDAPAEPLRDHPGATASLAAPRLSPHEGVVASVAVPVPTVAPAPSPDPARSPGFSLSASCYKADRLELGLRASSGLRPHAGEGAGATGGTATAADHAAWQMQPSGRSRGRGTRMGRARLGGSLALPAIFLDVGGCERLYGGLANLLEQVDEALRSFHVAARIAVAPSSGAAWALAAYAKENGLIIPTEQVRRAIAPLPPAALRLETEVLEALYHLGIQTIAQLLELPREALPARFGADLLLRIDQALGRVPEPLAALRHHAPVEARMDFDGVVDSLEAIWLVFKDLIARIVADLARRGCGARKAQLEFFRSDAPPISRTILLSRPSRDPVNLFNLMRCAMEGMEGEERQKEKGKRKNGRGRGNGGRSALAHAGPSDSMIPAGFTGVRLAVPVFEPVAEQQIRMGEEEEHDAQLELDSLIERLMLRLGDEGILQARLIESHLPERAYAGAALGTQYSALSTLPSALCRPLHLLPRPYEIAVMVSPSHDRDGRPVSISCDGRVQRIVHAVGPERIAGQWWEGHNKTRDYFAVEDDSGDRSWVFRVMETGRWYVHGSFE